MRAWVVAHPEYRRRQKEWEHKRQLDPEVRKKAVERARAWVLANPEKRKQTLAAYLPKTRVERTVKGREWQERNREQYRAYQRQYQSGRRTKGQMKLACIDLGAVEMRCEGLCGICKKPVEGAIHFDHIIPIARGGEHSEANLQIAHPLCNRLKGAKLGFSIT